VAALARDFDLVCARIAAPITAILLAFRDGALTWFVRTEIGFLVWHRILLVKA